MTNDTPSGALESLLARTQRGERPKYLFFWGHQPDADGRIGKSCFSQWFASPFTLDAICYPTAEHFMMAEKARLFGDDAVCSKILSARSPAEAKKLGRLISGFDEARWQQARFEIVVNGNLAKFSQSHALREFLLNTGERVLVEASPVDAIWGIGLAADDPRASNPEQWPGLNLLGFALMAVRARLQT